MPTMKIVAWGLVFAFALLANAGWCLDACCPPAQAAGPSNGVLAAPRCCDSAAAPAKEACPPSLERASSPALETPRALQASMAALVPTAASTRFEAPRRPASLRGSDPPRSRALSAPLPLLI
jgi:hypothetical protein